MQLEPRLSTGRSWPLRAAGFPVTKSSLQKVSGSSHNKAIVCQQLSPAAISWVSPYRQAGTQLVPQLVLRGNGNQQVSELIIPLLSSPFPPPE